MCSFKKMPLNYFITSQCSTVCGRPVLPSPGGRGWGRCCTGADSAGLCRGALVPGQPSWAGGHGAGGMAQAGHGPQRPPPWLEHSHTAGKWRILLTGVTHKYTILTDTVIYTCSDTSCWCQLRWGKTRLINITGSYQSPNCLHMTHSNLYWHGALNLQDAEIQ